MKRYNVTPQLLILAITTMPSVALSKVANVKHFGKNSPFTIADLPTSQAKLKLQALSAAVQKNALKRLHEISFTATDLKYLKIDNRGDAFYSDIFLPPVQTNTAATTSITEAPQPISATDAFTLHSKPHATNIIYLDFNGHVITGTAWNDATHPSYNAKSYDTDGNLGTFSNTELSAIHEIWHRIAEDYAPFDVDVTTQEPANFGPTVGRILITHNVDSNGQAMPASGSGGVAYMSVWGRNNYANYYSPALVYYNNLGSGYPPYIVEAASHEMGHNLGLSHDGTSTQGYYGGQGNGLVSWGPIMGVGYNQNVTQWSKGEYTDANNQQDDITIISNLLTYRTDDHSNIQATATPLVIDTTGSITVTNPENDPFNTETTNKGVIETHNDIDYFKLNVGTGALQLNVNPAWIAFARSDNRGANLDIQATLYDENGIQVAQVDPTDNTNATISANVKAGIHYLAITGVGNGTPATSYSDYGSLGEYFISGTVTPGTPTDTIAPTPNPMTWLSAPNANGSTSNISMQATVATDASGPVQYMFACVSGGSACTDSDWQSSNQYTATGLAPATAYSFKVKAKDTAGNTTEFSAGASATTAPSKPIDTKPPTPNPMRWLSIPTAQSSTSITMKSMLAADKPVSAIQYMFVCAPSGAGCADSGWQSSNQYTATGLSPATKYSFKVKAKDAAGNETTLSAIASSTTKQAPPLAPTNLTGSRAAATRVNLNWSPVGNATRYEIWRCTETTPTTCTYARTSTSTGNIYTGTAPASTVRYKVKAVNTAGTSNFSNEVRL